jgi:hypothetical protein
MTSTITSRVGAVVEGAQVQRRGFGVIIATGTTAGSANAQIGECAPAVGVSYPEDQLYLWIPGFTNTDPTVTLALDGLSAKAVKMPNGTSLPEIGDLLLGVPMLLRDAGTYFQIITI